jgi:deoxyribonuclease-4
MPPRTPQPGSPLRGKSGALLGAHMSIAGGMVEAVTRARSVEATALQVFVKSANQWAARPFAPGEEDAFRRAASDTGLARATVAHASYLINLASPDQALWKRSTEALGIELARCEALGIEALIVHPGAHMGAGEEAGLDRVVQALDRLLVPQRGQPPGRAAVLLEVTAGQGSCLGARFEHLGHVLARVAVPERVGICFDTCHALAAGYEFRDRVSYEETMQALDSAVGLDRLRAFHLNDSKTGLGSRRDRHEHIGRGEVGLEAFRLILNDPRFRGVPKLLETPKGDDLAEDRTNLGVLRSLVAH